MTMHTVETFAGINSVCNGNQGIYFWLQQVVSLRAQRYTTCWQIFGPINLSSYSRVNRMIISATHQTTLSGEYACLCTVREYTHQHPYTTTRVLIRYYSPHTHTHARARTHTHTHTHTLIHTLLRFLCRPSVARKNGVQPKLFWQCTVAPLSNNNSATSCPQTNTRSFNPHTH